MGNLWTLCAVTKEFKLASKVPGVTVQAAEDDPYTITMTVPGPELLQPPTGAAVASPYANKLFTCIVKVPAEYPHAA